MTICNMAIEAGAKYGMMQPDEITFEYVKGRPYASNFNQSIDWWRTLYSDEDAYFDKVIELDVSNLEPQVTWEQILKWVSISVVHFLKSKIQTMNAHIIIWASNLVKKPKILN